MRLIDADAIEVHTSSNVIRHIVMDTIDAQPTVDAIPVEFIESEKQRVQGMMEDAVKMGMIPEANRLSGVIAVLDAVVSNWRYNTGPEWRGDE